MVDDETEIIKDTKLSPLMRRIMVALITIDVHNRDIIQEMVDDEVLGTDDFNWQK